MVVVVWIAIAALIALWLREVWIGPGAPGGTAAFPEPPSAAVSPAARDGAA
jgi:hypothetical protein